jgi:hypothetical protein
MYIVVSLNVGGWRIFIWLYKERFSKDLKWTESAYMSVLFGDDYPSESVG